MPGTNTLLEFFHSVFLFSDSEESLILNIAIALLLFFIVYGLIKAGKKSIREVHSHWHHLFADRPFEPQAFYDTLKQQVQEKGIEGLSFSNVTHSERGLFSANRIYLRVSFREYMMDICAAPLAKEGFFVSWWLGNAGFTFRDFLISIPVIGRLFTRREKTFYELDTEIMFKETVAGCVKTTIEALTTTKGTRLTEMMDWRGTAMKFNS